MTSKVSLVKSDNHFDGTLQSLRKIQSEVFTSLEDKRNIVIKINFVSTYSELATTPSEAVRAILEFIKPRFSGEVIIAEGATIGDTQAGFEDYGYVDLAKEYGVKLFNLNEDETVPVQIWESSGGLTSIPYSRTLKEADYVISVTRPKTHDTVVATLTLKNLAVGGIIGARYRVHQGRMIHRNLVRLARARAPDLAVLDGTVGMEGRGPASGTPVKSGWAAASTDFVAADTLALDLMGFKLEEVGYLYLCGEEGLGQIYPERVEVIGEDPKDLRKQFKPHPTYYQQIQWR